MTSIRYIYSVNMIGHLYNMLPSAKHGVFHTPDDQALLPFPPSPSLLTGIVPQRPLRYFQRMSTPNLFCATHKHTMLVSTLPLLKVSHILGSEKIRSLGHTLKILCGPSPLSDGDGGNGNKTGVIGMRMENEYIESSGSNGQVPETKSNSLQSRKLLDVVSTS